MKTIWKDNRWNKDWNKWVDLPIEFRALLSWAFLTSGPEGKNEYFVLMKAMESWDHSRFSVLKEFEIRWITEKIKNALPDLTYKKIYKALTIYLNIGVSYQNIEDRFTKTTPKFKTANMISDLNFSKDRNHVMEYAWDWMEDWYKINEPNHDSPCFLNWVCEELKNIEKCEQFQNSNPEKINNHGNIILHLGKIFPITIYGGEIQKTIRADSIHKGGSTAWGYIHYSPGPNEQFSSFLGLPECFDIRWYQSFMANEFLHEDSAYVGGPPGLKDFSMELREAEKVLRRRNRLESPMSFLVMAP